MSSVSRPAPATPTTVTANKQTVTTFPLFTRKQGAQLIRTELGIPFPESRWDKDAMDGLAPKPSAIYGRVHLYNREQVLEYGRSLISLQEPAPQEAA
jgi:hypothetical protein